MEMERKIEGNIIYCTKRTKNKTKIVQWRLLSLSKLKIGTKKPPREADDSGGLLKNNPDRLKAIFVF